MAETEDGNRIFGNAYTIRDHAWQAAIDMIKEIENNMDLKLIPLVEETSLIDDPIINGSITSTDFI